jgi:hypothetical protein
LQADRVAVEAAAAAAASDVINAYDRDAADGDASSAQRANRLSPFVWSLIISAFARSSEAGSARPEIGSRSFKDGGSEWTRRDEALHADVVIQCIASKVERPDSFLARLFGDAIARTLGEFLLAQPNRVHVMARVAWAVRVLEGASCGVSEAISTPASSSSSTASTVSGTTVSAGSRSVRAIDADADGASALRVVHACAVLRECARTLLDADPASVRDVLQFAPRRLTHRVRDDGACVSISGRGSGEGGSGAVIAVPPVLVVNALLIGARAHEADAVEELIKARVPGGDALVFQRGAQAFTPFDAAPRAGELWTKWESVVREAVARADTTAGSGSDSDGSRKKKKKGKENDSVDDGPGDRAIIEVLACAAAYAAARYWLPREHGPLDASDEVVVATTFSLDPSNAVCEYIQRRAGRMYTPPRDVASKASGVPTSVALEGDRICLATNRAVKVEAGADSVDEVPARQMHALWAFAVALATNEFPTGSPLRLQSNGPRNATGILIASAALCALRADVRRVPLGLPALSARIVKTQYLVGMPDDPEMSIIDAVEDFTARWACPACGAMYVVGDCGWLNGFRACPSCGGQIGGEHTYGTLQGQLRMEEKSRWDTKDEKYRRHCAFDP